MADPTPPSDLPEPSSPTPASPAPGPKRIRSMPDRPASMRPPGTIRSMPTHERESSAYISGTIGEKSWGRGLGILSAIFLAVLILEMCNAAGYVLAGKLGWPLPIEVLRLGLVCTLFISLWAGLGWLRYLLATVDFLTGAWLLTDWILSYRATPKFKGTGEADWTIYSTIESYPRIALGLLYIGMAVYVMFSDDIREFIAHRRARGRVWTAVLVAMAVYGAMLIVFAAQPFYGHWMQGQQADAQRFGDETMRVISERWDADAIFSRLDAAYAKSFTKADREATFNAFKFFGHIKSIHPAPVVARPPTPQYPLQDKVPIPKGIESHPDVYGTWFELTAKYDTEVVEFEHGTGRFGFDLVRSMFGPWRITKLNVDNVQYDRPPPTPTPSPTATPAVPAVAPGTSPTPAPSVSPAGTPEGIDAPGASPARASTPVPVTPAASVPPAPAIMPTVTPTPTPSRPPGTPAPPPGGSVATPAATPAASPVPTTGG